MCLLDQLSPVHLKPNPSFRSSVERPQVATWPGSYLRTWWIDCLHALPRRRCWSGQGVCPSHDATGNLSAPECQVIRNFKRDRHEFNATDFADLGSEAGRPSSCLSCENRLQRLALLRISPLVDEKAHSGLGLAGPYVAFERGKGEQIEAVEPDLAVMAFADARVRSFPSSSRLQSGAIGRARCRTVSAGYELNRSTCGRATIVHMSIAAKSRQTPGVAPS